MKSVISPQLFKSFSNPFETVEIPITELIILTTYKNIINDFVIKNKDFINAHSKGVVELFELFLDKCDNYKLYADTTLSMIESVDSKEGDKLINVLTNLACYITFSGYMKNWEITGTITEINFGNTISNGITFDRVYHRNNASSINFISNDKLFVLEKDVHFHFEQFAFIKCTQKKELLVIPFERCPTVFKNRMLDESYEKTNSDFMGKVNAGLSVLHNYVPQYYDWVCGITTKIIVFNSGNENHLKSGSWEDSFCQYNLSINHDKYVIAEMLVHESSHQYFNLLKKVETFALNDEPLYFSPAVNKMRPLWLILLAYHAFANVALYYKLLQKHETSNIINIREEENLDLVQKLDAHLNNNPHLSPVGFLIYNGLKQQMQKS